jgi:hypothetical protein
MNKTIVAGSILAIATLVLTTQMANTAFAARGSGGSTCQGGETFCSSGGGGQGERGGGGGGSTKGLLCNIITGECHPTAFGGGGGEGVGGGGSGGRPVS